MDRYNIKSPAAPYRCGSALNDFRADILDCGSSYEVRAELAGFSRDEIEIILRRDALCINALKKTEETDRRENYIHRERRSSRLTRSFALSDIDVEHATARYEDGILHITLPKLTGKTAENGKRVDIG